MDDRKARARVRRLVKTLPTLYPVLFERADLDGSWGECRVVTRRSRKYLLVRVADWLPWPADFLVLMHELAHARAWKADKLEVHELQDHGPEWGIKYAELWRRADP